MPNIFLAFEPLAGKRMVKITERKKTGGTGLVLWKTSQNNKNAKVNFLKVIERYKLLEAEDV